MRRVFLACLFLANQALASTPSITAQVADLAWMSGAWSGPLGDSVVEEVWTAPRDGTIAAVVRFAKDGATGMVELIVVTEREDTLVLRLQQYTPDMRPLKAQFATLYLTELRDQQATFTARDLSGGLRQLIYTRINASTFSVDVTLAEGNQFTALMQAN